MAEYVWVSVEEVLSAVLVVEEFSLGGAEEGVGILLEGVPPCLEAAAGDVDEELLVLGAAPVLGDWGRWQRVRGDGDPSDGGCSGEGQPSGDGRHGAGGVSGTAATTDAPPRATISGRPDERCVTTRKV